MIGLTVTFAKDFKLPRGSIMPLIFIWIAFFLSIIFGIYTVKALITVLSPLKPTDAPFAISDAALWWARWQEWLFFIGVLLFISNGVIIIRSKRSSP
jgi:hypothetical protein